MRKVVIALLVIVIVAAIGVGLVLGAFALFGGMGKGSVSSATILELDLEQPLAEYVAEDPAAKLFMADTTEVREIVEALVRAADDDRVKGLVARVGGGGMGMAQAQEIRDAIKIFRDSGKPALAFSETFGEVGPGNVGYYVATAFDEIWLQPSGDLGLTGISLEGQFLKGTLDKLEIEPRMDQRHEYKNAMNQFTETSFTEPHREAMSRLAESWYEQIVSGISEARGKDADSVRALVDSGPFLGPEALEAGLVDQLGYRDQAYAAIRERAGDPDAGLLYATVYRERAGSPWSEGRKIALIYGSGAVVRGAGGVDPIFGGTSMGSDTVAGALRAAIEDDDVEAIVFRVDSPGGSYVASDAIWRETIRAKEAGKPVVISMGNLAASGGYFVSMHADRIVAQPGTVTGSIGVLGGKLITRDAWAKLGISFDQVKTAENALMYSGNVDYTEHGWERHQAWLDRVYDDFTSKVAEGRGLTLERVREVAKGRVWTGADALEVGLVDELGGLPRALDIARELAGIPVGADVHVELLPKPKTFLETIADKGPPSSDPQVQLARSLRRGLTALRPAIEAAARLGLLETEPSTLKAPPVPEAR